MYTKSLMRTRSGKTCLGLSVLQRVTEILLKFTTWFLEKITILIACSDACNPYFVIFAHAIKQFMKRTNELWKVNTNSNHQEAINLVEKARWDERVGNNRRLSVLSWVIYTP